ncbi:MAG: helix-turn-helix domain-containing protein [Paludibacteraceae bacterium]|nr:helix-turn-helix domain-containing protein [Paludibacteraceae bacterium]
MNRRRAFIISLLALFCSSLSLYADELTTSLQQFNRRATVANANRYMSALAETGFLDEPIVIAEGAESDSLRAVVWYWAAEYFYDAQNFVTAAQYGEQSIPLCRNYSDRVMHADCASLLGLIYVRLGDFSRAAKYAKECNELDLQSGNPDNIASSYNTLAGIYMSMRQPDEAEKYILLAIDYIHRVDNPAREAVIYGMASEVYQHKNIPAKSLKYATRAWELEKSLGRLDKAAVRQTQRAAALTVLEQYAEAEQCLTEAIPVLEQSGNYHSLAIAYNQMGDLLYVTGRNREGADYYYKALPIFMAQHDLYNEAHTRKGLRETLRGINPEEALEHGDRFEHLRDSIYDQEAKTNLTQLAAELGNDILQQLFRKQRARSFVTLLVICLLFIISALVTYIVFRRHQRLQVQHFNALLREVEILRSQERMKRIIDNSEEETKRRSEREADADDSLFLARVVEYINNALPQGDVSIEALADAMCMSVSTLRRRMQNASGSSPKAFIQVVQINKAKELLTTVPPPFSSIQEIANACGYKESNSFIRAFQRYTGVTPARWREQNKPNT